MELMDGLFSVLGSSLMGKRRILLLEKYYWSKFCIIWDLYCDYYGTITMIHSLSSKRRHSELLHHPLTWQQSVREKKDFNLKKDLQCMTLTHMWQGIHHKRKFVHFVDYNLIPDGLWIMNTVPGCFSHEEPEIRAVKWARSDVIKPHWHTLRRTHASSYTDTYTRMSWASDAGWVSWPRAHIHACIHRH